jgi:hypothetical protein
VCWGTRHTGALCAADERHATLLHTQSSPGLQEQTRQIFRFTHRPTHTLVYPSIYPCLKPGCWHPTRSRAPRQHPSHTMSHLCAIIKCDHHTPHTSCQARHTITLPTLQESLLGRVQIKEAAGWKLQNVGWSVTGVVNIRQGCGRHPSRILTTPGVSIGH